MASREFKDHTKTHPLTKLQSMNIPKIIQKIMSENTSKMFTFSHLADTYLKRLTDETFTHPCHSWNITGGKEG